MKDLIKQLLREQLDELATKMKPIFGGGVEHEIYASDKFPNMLFKVGDPDVVSKWVRVFQSKPELYPKIYRTGNLRDGRGYAGIEKLNTQRVVNEWHEMELALEEVGYVDTDVFDDTINQFFIGVVTGKISEAGVYKRLEHNKKVQILVKKWITFFKLVFRHVLKFGYNGFDIHRYNFAYDSGGNIKAIDI